jgi:hypothetical protein
MANNMRKGDFRKRVGADLKRGSAFLIRDIIFFLDPDIEHGIGKYPSYSDKSPGRSNSVWFFGETTPDHSRKAA